MLRSDPLIMLEQPAEPLAATGLAERQRPSGAKTKARRNVGANGNGPEGAIVKFGPNQSPLTTKSCRFSKVGAHSIGRRRISPSHKGRSP
jgi:hypothetical protein